jgi:hypothetical protein
MTARRKSRATQGFGFDPTESRHHFVLRQDRATDAVAIEEHFTYGDDAGKDEVRFEPRTKALLTDYQWSRIVKTVTDVFNAILRREELATGTWTRETMLSPSLGKELTLLFWAVEDADPTVIPDMLANWRGLAREERWWLYTTINATSSHPDHRHRGWRKAIKIAFAENPVGSLPPMLLADSVPPPKRRTTRKRVKTDVAEAQQQSLL